MYVNLNLEEVDRGKLQLGQAVRVRVDAIPDKEFNAAIDYISPIASLVFKGGSTPEKTFPARATLKNLDPRLRPGMSATAEIIIERQPNMLLIPVRASFDRNGKPAVYVQIGKNFVMRPIQVGKQNDEDIIVTGGLQGRRNRDAGKPGRSGQEGQEEAVAAQAGACAGNSFHEKGNLSNHWVWRFWWRRAGTATALQTTAGTAGDDPDRQSAARRRGDPRLLPRRIARRPVRTPSPRPTCSARCR